MGIHSVLPLDLLNYQRASEISRLLKSAVNILRISYAREQV